MFYDKKLLICILIVSCVASNSFIAMEKGKQEQRISDYYFMKKESGQKELLKNIKYALFDPRYLKRLEKILDDNPVLVNVSMWEPKYGIVSPLEYAVSEFGYHGHEELGLNTMRLLIARGAKSSPLVIEKISEYISNLFKGIDALEDSIKNTKYEIVAKTDERSIVKIKSSVKSLQELKSYLEEKMQEQQRQEWRQQQEQQRQQVESPRILNLQTTQPKTQSIEYLKSLGRK